MNDITDKPEAMYYYITKYALTSGVIMLPEETVTFSEFSDNIIHANLDSFCKPDWHTSVEDAKARIAEMIRVKLSSLENQKTELLQLSIDDMFAKSRLS